MLSKAQNKYIRSLTQQKFRNEHGVFVAEGVKIAGEWLLSDTRIDMIVAIEEWVAGNSSLIARHPDAVLCIVKPHELEAVSGLQAPNQVLLVVRKPEAQTLQEANEWCLALDDIQDPGNMGTMIRIADWFGIKHIICSPGCVDVYNPKVVQSAMGGHLRVKVYEEELDSFLSRIALPKYVAVLDGENVYDVKGAGAGVLIIGNESKGVSAEVSAIATHKVFIPRRGGAESLNAAVSAGILCALLMQR